MTILNAAQMHSFANACAADDAADAQTPDCGDHRLGVETTCPACWAWHCGRKRPSQPTREAIRAILAEQRELAGEDQLDSVAADLAAFYQVTAPTSPGYFDALEDRVSRLASRLRPTSRRRRALSEIAVLARFDPAVSV